INNAGIAPYGLFEEIKDATMAAVISVHLMGHIWLSRAAWPHLVAQRFGRIVNTSSSVALTGMLYQPIYSAVKCGILGLTRALAPEGSLSGITVNAVLPSAMTSMRPHADARLRPELVAPLVGYLAHERCALSGAMLEAEGGGIREVVFAMTGGLA